MSTATPASPANPEPRAKKRAAAAGKYGLSQTKGSHALNMFEVDGELLRDAIAHVVIEGDAVLFGMTRDQSAVKLQLLTDGGSEELYAGTTEALEDALRVVRDAST